MSIHYKETPTGFEFGNAKVTRLFSDEKKGWVTIGIKTDKYERAIQIYVTKTGKVRVHSNSGEWVARKREVSDE